jgi:hypothetical protein
MSDSTPDIFRSPAFDPARGTPDLVEAIARRVVELLDGRSAATETPLLSAHDVAQRFGVGRKWVYEHADDLGVIRLGAGRRARMRFKATVVEERLRRLRATTTDAPRRKPASSETSDLLPIYGRAPRR